MLSQTGQILIGEFSSTLAAHCHLEEFRALEANADYPSMSLLGGDGMVIRHARCNCGQLNLTIEGQPSRIAMCHCLECQRRTGAVTSNQARFRMDQVGKTSNWTMTAESENTMTYHFCPTCGSTVFWENDGFPGHVSIAIGNFADPTFPAPTVAVWEETRHPWLNLPEGTPPNRAAKLG
jgi:hypothetical protein